MSLLLRNLRPSTWRGGMNIKRGSIYVAALDPVIGKEISKTRPVVVVSNDINNLYSGTVTIIPITSKNLQKIYPFEVLLAKGNGNLSKNSKIKSNQIRTLDKTRIVKFIGALDKKIMDQIDKSIKIHLALP
jgi:mRNA interferase MazF